MLSVDGVAEVLAAAGLTVGGIQEAPDGAGIDVTIPKPRLGEDTYLEYLLLTHEDASSVEQLGPGRFRVRPAPPVDDSAAGGHARWWRGRPTR